MTLGSYFSHCLYKAYMCMNVDTCAHTHAHTHTQRLGLYHLQSFYKAYMCMNEHTYTHVHTHTVPLVVTLGSYFSHCHCFHKVYMCMNVTHLCRHSHHGSWRCEIKLSYWAEPLLNFILFAMLSFVPLA